MKNLFLSILLLAVYSCRKYDVPQIPKCEAVTYYLDSYNELWKYVKTDVSYHQCSVCNEDLDRFRAYDTLTQICGENRLMRLVIGKDTCLSKN